MMGQRLDRRWGKVDTQEPTLCLKRLEIKGKFFTLVILIGQRS